MVFFSEIVEFRFEIPLFFKNSGFFLNSTIFSKIVEFKLKYHYFPKIERFSIFLKEFCLTAESHLGTTLSVGWSVGPSVLDTKFQHKIKHEMDTVASAVTQLGVPALVLATTRLALKLPTIRLTCIHQNTFLLLGIS